MAQANNTGRKSSLLDGDFLDSDDFGSDDDDAGAFASDRSFDFSDDDSNEEVTRTRKKPAGQNDQNDDLDIEIVDDTPEKDRGKWVVDPDKDGEPPDLPDEIEQYSADVKKRLKQYTARSHAERRRADELARQLEEAKKVATGLLQHNNKLSELVENGEKVLVGEHKTRLEGQLAQTKAALREAHEAGDSSGIAAAQEQLARIAAALDRVSLHRPQPMPRTDPSQIEKAFAVQQAQPQPDQQALSWQSRNKWWGNDTVMTAFAMGVHAHLLKNEGLTGREPEYWQRMDQEIQGRFPERFEQRGNSQSREPQQRRSIVAPASRAGSSAPKKVTLTESEVRLARRLGLTPKQYAEEKIKLDRQNRE